MQIDRRITNGLAWAGAVFVVAIPLADFAAKQMAAPAAPSVAVVREEAEEAPAMPTPVAERPAATAPVPAQPEPAAAIAEAAPAQPAQVANATPAAKPSTVAPGPIDGQDAFNAYLRSGRQVPSYISGASPSAAKPAAPAAPVRDTAAVTGSTTSVPTAAPAETEIASVPTPKTVTLPTPVSQRPPSVATFTRTPSPAAVPATQPPLIIDTPTVVADDRAPIVSADDLADWESGPLSDFLARREAQNGRAVQPVDDYDPNGFFLDQGPNVQGQRRFPSAYDSGFYFPSDR